MEEFARLKNELFLNIADGLAKIEHYLDEQQRTLKTMEVSNCLKTYATAEACEILHVSQQTLSHLAKTGKIRGTKIGQGWVFREAELIRFLKEREGKNNAD